MAYSGHNPNPNEKNSNVDAYPSRECAFCGETVKHLPAHLRRHCEEA